MSFLWENRKIEQRKYGTLRPSPKRRRDTKNNAQNYCIHNVLIDAIKRISLFISKSVKVEGSMTVEAAIVLPLFLFFFLNLGTAIEMIRFHGNMEFALCDVGRRMSVYGYALTVSEAENEISEEEKSESQWLAEIEDLAFSYTYVKKEILEYLGREYLESSPVTGGVAGLYFPESEIFGEEDCFEIIVTYEMAPFGKLVGGKGFRMANRYYAHLWNGYQIPGAENVEEADEVYVAQYGEVYHEDEMCSHLFLSVREVSLEEAYESRNSSGAKYTLCEYCEEFGVNGLVYIAEDGDRIHFMRNCSGLKRTVYKISREDAIGLQPCSRCAKR